MQAGRRDACVLETQYMPRSRSHFIQKHELKSVITLSSHSLPPIGKDSTSLPIGGGFNTHDSGSSPNLTKADSLALQMGLSHVVLGVNMPAVAVPHSPAVGG
jgi:hypothetical protein